MGQWIVFVTTTNISWIYFCFQKIWDDYRKHLNDWTEANRNSLSVALKLKFSSTFISVWFYLFTNMMAVYYLSFSFPFLYCFLFRRVTTSTNWFSVLYLLYIMYLRLLLYTARQAPISSRSLNVLYISVSVFFG